MSLNKLSCFVIMPYLPELNYFYLYVKGHIEKSHHLDCVRADETIRTTALLDKINDLIDNAHVILADCTGRNPNVFYELGIAHAKGKKVILITHDNISDAPSDIKHFEFIKYKLDEHLDFLQKLDNVLNNVFVEQYENLFSDAQKIFYEFQSTTKSKATIASKNEFIMAVKAAESTKTELPTMDDGYEFLEFVLPRIISNPNDFDIMNDITKWIAIESTKYPKSSDERKQMDSAFDSP